ncbi:MAG: hypothetical protein PHW25_20805 [Zoogloea sp.]|uniref:hypothetical protein n=1 Tax=Zoogloea sp. TaxID=49181 RepID=UPI002635A641|nr:hypothetical protein [Zoogloea sp.]MDD3329526.1 hypothetical protein [Zoogloea sp.]
MTDKLEVAKLATQLTIALIENKQLNDVGLQRVIRSSEDPQVVAVFDYLFKHVQALLTEQ